MSSMVTQILHKAVDGERLTFDEGSRTSAALAQILLQERYGVRPAVRPLLLDADAEASGADAVLLIGDRAMKACLPGFRYSVDLGEEWFRWTGLPFVFAFWAVREGFKDDAVVDDLKRSRDFGVANIPTIAEKYSESLQIKKEFVQEYLEKNVHYYMDQACLDALQLFYGKAAHAGVIKSVRGLQFV